MSPEAFNKVSARKPRLWVLAGTSQNHRELSNEYIEQAAAIAAPGAEIQHLRKAEFPDRSWPVRLFQMVVKAISDFAAGLKHLEKGDVVLTSAAETNSIFIVALVSLIRGTSFMLIWRGEPEAKAEELGNPSPSIRIRDYLDRWAYKHTACIFVGRGEFAAAARKTAGLDIPILLVPEPRYEVEFFDDSHSLLLIQ